MLPWNPKPKRSLTYNRINGHLIGRLEPFSDDLRFVNSHGFSEFDAALDFQGVRRQTNGTDLLSD